MRVLKKMGATVWAREMMHKEVVETVLLYGNKSWGITREMTRVLEAFYHRIMRRLMGKTSHRVGG